MLPSIFLFFVTEDVVGRQVGWYASWQPSVATFLYDLAVLDASTIVAVGDSRTIV